MVALRRDRSNPRRPGMQPGLRLALSAAAAALVLLLPHAAAAQSPDIEQLIAQVDAQRLREHVDAIDVQRNAFAQPEALDAAATYVHSQFESIGLDVTDQPVTLQDATFPNVIAALGGTMCPERIFIVGAHYDSVAASPGADDNATGVAGILEIARALADMPLPASVWFVSFTMEEDGLVGGRHLAEKLAQQDARVAGMYSFDMIGYTAGEGNDFIAVLGNTASIRLTDAVHRSAELVPALPVVVLNLLGNGEEQPDSRRSDHAPFWDRGWQALLVTDTANFRNPNYHQPTDTIDTLDFAFATNVTKLMLATTVDYLTYDGDDDGDPDVCSGPLAATPTPTVASTVPPPLVVSPLPTPPPPGLPPAGTTVPPDQDEARWPLVLVVGVLGTLGVVLLRVRLGR